MRLQLCRIDEGLQDDVRMTEPMSETKWEIRTNQPRGKPGRTRSPVSREPGGSGVCGDLWWGGVRVV